MKIEYDQLKSDENHKARGLPFSTVSDFMFSSALVLEDRRADYKEQRFNALGLIGSRVHHLTFTLRDDVVRIISLRKANNREIKRYEQP